MKCVLVFAWVLGFCGSAFAFETPLPFFERKDLTPVFTGAAQAGEIARVGTFSLTNQEGQPVTDSTLRGRMSVVSFFFADCGSICPRLMSVLQKFRKQLDRMADAPRFYSMSVTLERDSAAKLKTYAKTRGIDLAHWDLITGDRGQIFKIGRDTLQADKRIGTKDERSDFIHSDNVYLLDGALRVRGIYSAFDAGSMKNLAADIARLKTEKAD